MNSKEFILQHKIVAIARQVYGDDLLKAAQAIHKAGIRILEITFDQTAKDNATCDAIALIKDHFNDQMCVGAGTVMSVEQAQNAKDAGADFALAPNTNIEVIKAMKKLDLVAIPGALTPSEIASAYQAGGDIIKLFPANAFNLGYIKALRAPLNHIPLMAVGGVNENNIQDFFNCGMCSVGIGSNLINYERAKNQEFSVIERIARQCVMQIYG